MVAGLLVVLVGYSSSLAVVIESARAVDLDPARTASWVCAISLGSGISGLLLTLLTRMPIIAAWSTPGAALLIGSIGGFSFEEAVGAFILSSAAATVLGATGWFGMILRRIPDAVLQALLAGVLLPFIVRAVASFERAPLLAGGIAAAFFIGKRFLDRYAVLLALVAGIALTALTDGFGGLELALAPTAPVLTVPHFTLPAAMSIALPLFLVTMASQNAPGLAILRFEGYRPNDRLLVGGVSAISTACAFFGSHAVNLAAISAAIAAGSDAHPDRDRRYIAGLTTGIVYILGGLSAAQITAAFEAIPTEAITVLAAVSLLGTALAALRGAVGSDVRTGVAAVATLAVTMSGVAFLGAGSAFWGLLVGAALVLLLRTRADRARKSARADAAGAGAEPA